MHGRRLRTLLAATLAAALAPAAAVAATLAAALAPAAAVAAPSGPAAATCSQVRPELVAPCYAADVLGRDADAVARPGRYREAIDAWERSPLHRTLASQYALAGDVPLRDAPWIGTHNSFNSIAEMGPTLSDLDANQRLGLIDQLRLDVRSLELDVHWFPNAQAAGNAVVVCHGDGQVGCSVERTFGPVLDEIAGWLREHRDQVLLLYLEDNLHGLDGSSGHDAAATAIRDHLGALVYRPRGAGCTKLPLDLMRRDVLREGAQVLLVSGCGSAAWNGQVFDWGGHLETRPQGFAGFPGCGPDFTRAQYDTNLIRYFEDSTGVTTGASAVGASSVDDGITPATARAMARCGVDLLGLDQLVPDDGRLEALAWTWADGEPGRGRCAMQRGGDGRWEARRCTGTLRPACRSAAGSWTVPDAPVRRDGAPAACAAAGASLSVPRTAYEAQLLRSAAGGADTWLGYERTHRGWQALDAR